MLNEAVDLCKAAVLHCIFNDPQSTGVYPVVHVVADPFGQHLAAVDVCFLCGKDASFLASGDKTVLERYAYALFYYPALGSTIRAGVLRAGMFSAADHVMQGYKTWATPDGRKTGEAIADAASPAQGVDKNGPTGVFMSATC